MRNLLQLRIESSIEECRDHFARVKVAFDDERLLLGIDVVRLSTPSTLSTASLIASLQPRQQLWMCRTASFLTLPSGVLISGNATLPAWVSSSILPEKPALAISSSGFLDVAVSRRGQHRRAFILIHLGLHAVDLRRLLDRLHASAAAKMNLGDGDNHRRRDLRSVGLRRFLASKPHERCRRDEQNSQSTSRVHGNLATSREKTASHGQRLDAPRRRPPV